MPQLDRVLLNALSGFERWLDRYAEALTPERVRTHAIVGCAGLWVAAAWVLSTPGLFDRNGTLKGIDFLQFYAAGWFVASGQAADLYDWPLFAAALPRLVAGIQDLLFLPVYPPQVGLLFAPLGMLAWLPALLLWSAVSALLYFFTARTVYVRAPALQRFRVAWWAAVLGFVPFHQLVLHGQIASLVLLCVTAAWLAIRNGRWFLAGLACGALAFKPQFGVLGLLLVVFQPRLAVVSGGAVAVLLQIGATAIAVGPEIWADYIARVGDVLAEPEVFEPKLWQMHNLKGTVQLLLGTGTLGLAATLAASIGAVVLGRRAFLAAPTPDLKVAALVLTACLVNPHLYVYDLVVVGLALALVTAWALQHPGNPRRGGVLALVHVLCWIPLLGPVAAVTRLQLTVPVMLLLVWQIRRTASAAGSSLPPVVGERTTAAF